MKIVGVSFDDPDDNADWARDERFAFELWSDTDKTLAIYYGAAADDSALWADRITRLLDADGDVALLYETVSVSQGPQDVLEDCQALFGE